MIAAAAAGSLIPGSWIEIWSLPCVRISGSATPSLSTRERMIETDRSRSSLVSFRSRGGTAWSVTSSPPCRSSPSVGFCSNGDPGMASSPTPTRAASDERDDESCSAAGHVGPLRLAAVERRGVLRGVRAHDFLGVVNTIFFVRVVGLVQLVRRRA